MVGRLCMRDVSAIGPLHVARSAVRLVGMVPCGEGVAMTGQAFTAVVRNPFLGARCRMRIVATRAGQLIARFLLADALSQRFALAQRAKFASSLVLVDIVVNIVSQVIAGAEISKMFPRLLNGNVP